MNCNTFPWELFIEQLKILQGLYYILEYSFDIGVSHQMGDSIHRCLDREDDAGNIIFQRVIQA